MKKFYLSISDRDTIVNALLRENDRLEKEWNESADKGRLGPVSDIIESTIQQRGMLATLLRVEEVER